MAKRPRSAKSSAQKAIAWFALLMVVVWLGMTWSSAHRRPEPKARSVSAEREPEVADTTETSAAKDQKAEITAELLNFRARPISDDKSVIGTIKKGTIVTVVKKESGWLFIRLDNGQSGYVFFKPEYYRFFD